MFTGCLYVLLYTSVRSHNIFLYIYNIYIELGECCRELRKHRIYWDISIITQIIFFNPTNKHKNIHKYLKNNINLRHLLDNDEVVLVVQHEGGEVSSTVDQQTQIWRLKMFHVLRRLAAGWLTIGSLSWMVWQKIVSWIC